MTWLPTCPAVSGKDRRKSERSSLGAADGGDDRGSEDDDIGGATEYIVAAS
jgi:hypothetical protein